MLRKVVPGYLRVSSGAALRRGQATAAAAQKAPAEKKAAGPRPNASFVTNMFAGATVTDQLLPYPDTLSEERRDELQMLIEPTERFFADVNNPDANDKLEAVEPATLEGLKEMGAFGLQVPGEYGGIGCNNTQYARMVEIVGGNDLGVGIVLGAHQSIGFKGILIAGTPEQKAQYLPRVASGEHMAAFALTEPGSGSDANSIKTRAVPSEDGSHYVLNGSKIWISNGGFAEVFTVFAKSPVPNAKTGELEDRVTAFIVERAFGGVSNGAPCSKMGIKCSNTTEVYFDNVRIPKENVLGAPGNGFKVAMEILNNGRFGMAAAMSGCMRTSIATATDFAANRLQFGAKINTFGTIQEKLARMAMLHYATESMAYMISANMDGGSKDYHLEAAISKAFGSEAAWAVTDEAIQVLGGMGFMRETGLERVMRDLRIFRIFEGTNDILRLLVALTGMQFGGQHLKELTTALKSPVSNMGLLLDETSKRAKRSLGVTPEQLPGAHVQLARQAHDIAQTVGEFSGVVESLLLKHRKDIINRQFELNRVANAAIELYSSACVLSRASRALERGVPSAEHELRLARVWINEACQRARYGLMVSRSAASAANFADLTALSDELCANGGVVAGRPLGF